MPQRYSINAFVLLVLHFVIALAFLPAIVSIQASLASIFYSGYYGISILLIAIYIYYNRLNGLYLSHHIKLPFLIFLFVICAVYSASNMIGAELPQYISLFVSLVIVQCILFSKDDIYKILPAVLFLIFILPLWAWLNPFLLNLSGIVVSMLVGILDISINFDKNIINLPYGKLEIADGCSGLRYLVITLLLAYLMVISSQVKRFQMAFIFVLAILLALLFNWLRIGVLVVIAYESKFQSDLVYDHETFGWLLYLAVIFILGFIYTRLKPASLEKPTDYSTYKNVPWFKPVLIVMVVFLGTHFFKIMPQNLSSPEIDTVFTADNSLLKPKMLENRRFKRQDVTVDAKHPEVTIVRSANWRLSKSDELVPYMPELKKDNTWHETESTTIKINNIEFRQITQKNIINEQLRIKLYVFDLGGAYSNSYTFVKLMQLNSILKQQNIFYLYELTIDCPYNGCDEAKNKVYSVVEKLFKNKY